MCNVLSDKDLISKLTNKYKELYNIYKFHNYFLSKSFNKIPLPILYIKLFFNRIINSNTQIKNFLLDDDNQIVSKLNWITSRNKNKKSVLENIFDNLEIIKLIQPLEIFEEGLIRLLYNKTRHCTCSFISCKKIHSRNFKNNKFTGSIKFYSHYNKKKLETYEFAYDLNYLTYDGKKIVLKSFLDADLVCHEKLNEEKDIRDTFLKFSKVCKIIDTSKRKRHKDDDDTKEYLSSRKKLKLMIIEQVNEFWSEYKDVEEKRIIESASPFSKIIMAFKNYEGKRTSPTLAF